MSRMLGTCPIDLRWIRVAVLVEIPNPRSAIAEHGPVVRIDPAGWTFDSAVLNGNRPLERPFRVGTSWRDHLRSKLADRRN
eukprot:4894046-Alexandrium_andersonii.AAC.1